MTVERSKRRSYFLSLVFITKYSCQKYKKSRTGAESGKVLKRTDKWSRKDILTHFILEQTAQLISEAVQVEHGSR